MKKVIDKQTNEPIYGVQIYDSNENGIVSDPPKGTISGFDGNFQFIPNANYVTIRHLSYKIINHFSMFY